MEANSNTPAVGDLVESTRPGLRRRLAWFRPVSAANGAVRTRDPALGRTARRLEDHLFATGARLLHERRLPGKAGKVSHLIVASSGITLVDSRKYTSGRARVGRGGLRVGRRNRSDLVHRVRAQVDELRALLADTPYADVPIEAAIAWRDVQGLPILYTFNGPRVLICGTRKIAHEATRPGPFSLQRVDALADYLESELPLA